jgi:sterol desaturase/sphingolipid hydroxylase (fatty acid hydroxylase superfamily)
MPLRKNVKRRSVRLLTNFAMIASATFFIKIIFGKLFILNFKFENALFNLMTLDPKIEFIVSFLTLDLMIYFWHRINHRFDFLWRFHKVHHFDQELDASTALRFHFGELFFSQFYRFPFIFLLGIKAEVLFGFEFFTTALAIFHHSNINLPFLFENILNKFLVTPKMHEIHHSVKSDEMRSNLGTVFSFWDRLFKSHVSISSTQRTEIGLYENNHKSNDQFLASLKSPFV